MISLRTTAAPYLPGWMHQRRYGRPALGRCPSAAVALAAAGAAGMIEPPEESAPAECRSPRHRPPCGRPWGPEEDRGTRSPGPTRGTTLVVLPER
jgi:hypothetical protein